MKITLLIPTLNEFSGMKEIMPRIKKDWVDEILIVDGGSDDGTLEYAKENNYTVISQRQKGLRKGYGEAVEHITGDAVITFSPDGNSVPELIPVLVNKIKEGFDMVIVSRYAPGAQSYDDDVITAFGNWMLAHLINLFFNARYTDAMVMFRAWRVNIFRELELDKDSNYSLEERVFNTKIGVEPLLSIRAAKRKLRYAEIPGDEPLRVGGERKLQVVRWGAAYLAQVVREVFVR